jgi:hypothetical protein
MPIHIPPIHIPPQYNAVDLAAALGHPAPQEDQPLVQVFAPPIGNPFNDPLKKNLVKKMPVPKTDAPPLELNLKAKMLTPWLKLNTLDEFDTAVKQGRYIEYYSDVLNARLPISPLKILAEGKKLHFLQSGAYVHTSKMVRVFAPIKRKHVVTDETIIAMWGGNHYQRAVLYQNELGNRFIQWLSPFQMVIWDGENEQVAF